MIIKNYMLALLVWVNFAKFAWLLFSALQHPCRTITSRPQGHVS